MAKPNIDPDQFLPLTPAVFHILLALADGERHGYAIMQSVAETTEGQIKMGPGRHGTIKRLLENKLIEECEDRPDPELDDERRRYYGLTALGRACGRSRSAPLFKTGQGGAEQAFYPADGDPNNLGGLLMSIKPISRVEFVSEKIYGRLLALYPAEHRRKYGPLMAQLFRDQCRDAYRQQRSLGLLKLWCRVLPDIAATSVVEHIAAVGRREVMFHKLALASQRWLTGLGVFLLVVTGSFVITLLLPRTYLSTVRMRVEKPGNRSNFEPSTYDPYLLQTVFEVLQSKKVLYPVIQDLQLDKKWSEKYRPEDFLAAPRSVSVAQKFHGGAAIPQHHHGGTQGLS